MKMNRFVIVFMLCSFFSCTTFQRFAYDQIPDDTNFVLQKSQIDSIVGVIEKYHPNPYGLHSKSYISHCIDSLVHVHENDYMTESEWNLYIKKVINLYQYNDPHIMFSPFLRAPKGYKGKVNKIKVLPFDILQINDTLIVADSYNKLVRKGDRIVSINEVDDKELLMYQTADDWRCYHGYLLQLNCPKLFSEKYNIVVERDGINKQLTFEGIPYRRLEYGNPFFEKEILEKQRIGYFRIFEFQHNNFMAHQLGTLAKNVKAKGFSNIIIDLRNNPGGTGKDLDNLFSVISKQDSLQLGKSQLIKVSDETIPLYEFLSDHPISEVVPMPDSLIFKSFPLERDKYVSGIKYYLLVDKGTGSTAASFFNIFQYNNLGIVAGEPLKHNALDFGDVIKKEVFGRLIISTIQYKEHTNANNGILNPDIFIPYVAKDYMHGGDPVLENLIGIINNAKTR